GDRRVDHLDSVPAEPLTKVTLQVVIDRLVIPNHAVLLLSMSGHRLKAVGRRSPHHEDAVDAVRLDLGRLLAPSEALTIVSDAARIAVAGGQLDVLVVVEPIAHEVLAVVSGE